MIVHVYYLALVSISPYDQLLEWSEYILYNTQIHCPNEKLDLITI